MFHKEGDVLAWLETIMQWFSEEDVGGDRIIDEKWQMLELNGDPSRFAVSNANLPFEIGIYINEEFAHLNVFTNLETMDWEVKDQRDIYHDLLVQNNKNLFVKFYLSGEKDTVALRTELDLAYLNKREFNDALQAVIVGTMWLMKKMGLLDEKSCDPDSDEEIMDIILNMFKKGVSKHEIINHLINDCGINAEEATEKVFSIAKNGNNSG